MDVVEIGNYLVFIIYTLVLYKSVKNFLSVHKARLYGTIQMLVYAFCFTTAMQSASFMILQIEWILEDNNEAVTDVASWGWMFYDYFNGFCLLTYCLCIETYMGWRIPDHKDFQGHKIPKHRAGESEDHSMERTQL